MTARLTRVFLLSPANCSGRRAQILLNDRASFTLARAIHSDEGASIAQVFTFLSGLYFRGKIAYARKFMSVHGDLENVFVITAGRGLMPAETIVRAADLREFAQVPIDLGESRYREPLLRDARQLADRLSKDGQAVLLGSVATDKYASLLVDAFGSRLVFPYEFVGRGDMSRGGLLLRCIDQEKELSYVPLEGAVRHGARPPKLAARTRSER